MSSAERDISAVLDSYLPDREKTGEGVLRRSPWDYGWLGRKVFAQGHEGFFRLCIEGMSSRNSHILMERWFAPGWPPITIGLGTAGALVSGGASQVLSGTSAAVIGAKESVDKNAFFDQTMPALNAKMIAQRKLVLVGIRDGLLNKTDAQYPLAQGLAALEEYYYAGTNPRGDQRSRAERWRRSGKTDAQLKLVFNRPREFVSKSVQARVDAIAAALEDSTQVSDSQVLALANNPPASGAEFTKIYLKTA